jgi:hypothetical protein
MEKVWNCLLRRFGMQELRMRKENWDALDCLSVSSTTIADLADVFTQDASAEHRVLVAGAIQSARWWLERTGLRLPPGVFLLLLCLLCLIWTAPFMDSIMPCSLPCLLCSLGCFIRLRYCSNWQLVERAAVQTWTSNDVRAYIEANFSQTALACLVPVLPDQLTGRALFQQTTNDLKALWRTDQAKLADELYGMLRAFPPGA